MTTQIQTQMINDTNPAADALVAAAATLADQETAHAYTYRETPGDYPTDDETAKRAADAARLTRAAGRAALDAYSAAKAAHHAATLAHIARSLQTEDQPEDPPAPLPKITPYRDAAHLHALRRAAYNAAAAAAAYRDAAEAASRTAEATAQPARIQIVYTAVANAHAAARLAANAAHDALLTDYPAAAARAVDFARRHEDEAATAAAAAQAHAAARPM